jgi:hypothetical protein
VVALRVLRSRYGPGAASLLEAMLADDPDRRPSLREWYELTRPATNAPSPMVVADEPPPAVSAAPGGATPSTGPADGEINGNWTYDARLGCWVRGRPTGRR